MTHPAFPSPFLLNDRNPDGWVAQRALDRHTLNVFHARELVAVVPIPPEASLWMGCEDDVEALDALLPPAGEGGRAAQGEAVKQILTHLARARSRSFANGIRHGFGQAAQETREAVDSPEVAAFAEHVRRRLELDRPTERAQRGMPWLAGWQQCAPGTFHAVYIYPGRLHRPAMGEILTHALRTQLLPEREMIAPGERFQVLVLAPSYTGENDAADDTVRVDSTMYEQLASTFGERERLAALASQLQPRWGPGEAFGMV